MKKILIIEDHALNRILLRDIMQMHGHETLESVTAEDGLRIAEEQKPDLILVDIQLPGMDGLTATRRLKSDPQTKHIPVIVITSFAMEYDKQRALSSGCDAYMPKPIDTRKLPELVAELLEKKPSQEYSNYSESSRNPESGT